MIDINEKPKRKRVCHTCAISMDNILVESIRHSQEMSFNGMDTMAGELAQDITKGRNPMLARSFEIGVKHANPIYSMAEVPEKVKFNMSLTITPKAAREITGMNIGLEDALKHSITVDQTFGDQPNDMFYEPSISKPIRSHRDVTIKLNTKGKLEGMPTAWREAL